MENEDRIREIVREEIALWYTGGRTDSLRVVREETAVTVRNFVERWNKGNEPCEDDGPIVTKVKSILRGDEE